MIASAKKTPPPQQVTIRQPCERELTLVEPDGDKIWAEQKPRIEDRGEQHRVNGRLDLYEVVSIVQHHVSLAEHDTITPGSSP